MNDPRWLAGGRAFGRHVPALLVVLGGAVACGASNAPAQTGGATPAASTVPELEPGPAAPAEASGSPELASGVKAFDAGNYAEARGAFEAATRKSPRDYQAFYNLGMACEKLGDKAAAEAAYASALALKPDFDTAAAALSSLDIDAGRTDDALAVARSGLAKSPGSAPLHENLGVALAMRGDRDNAAQEFEEAVKTVPTEPMYQLTFAHWLNVWHARGASPHLDAALAMAGADIGLVAAIGQEYRMAGDFPACIKTFDRAVQMKDGGEVRTERALCKVGQKDAKGALEDLQAAVSVEPSYATAHYYLGGRLASLKRYKEAGAEYAKYLELAPHGSMAAQASERLKMVEAAAGRAASKGR